MTDFLKNYILTVTAISILGLFLDCLLPNGNIKKYSAFGVSIILSIALIQPIAEFLKKDFEPEIYSAEYYFDYTEAVKSTVNSIKGFEDAQVFVEQEKNKITKITVISNNWRVLDKAIETTSTDFLKKMLNAVYGVSEQEIYFSG